MSELVHVSSHPLIASRIAELRHKSTQPARFRELVRQLAQLLFFEAAEKLQVETMSVSTPLSETSGWRLKQRIGLIPILRAGLGMVDGILEYIPEAQVWHLGLYRNEETLEPVTYYNKLPSTPCIDLAMVLDPMLATGGSSITSLSILKRWGAKELWYLGLIAAPEGVKRMQAAHPDVPIFLGAIDSHLNYQGYIVPGLGDAGDRQFATA